MGRGEIVESKHHPPRHLSPIDEGGLENVNKCKHTRLACQATLTISLIPVVIILIS
jgi:hypothetical protein